MAYLQFNTLSEHAWYRRAQTAVQRHCNLVLGQQMLALLLVLRSLKRSLLSWVLLPGL